MTTKQDAPAPEPVAWALTMPDGIRALHLSREASVAYSKGWPDAYAGCAHVPLYSHPAAPAPDAKDAEIARLRVALETLSKAGWDAVDVRCFAMDVLAGEEDDEA